MTRRRRREAQDDRDTPSPSLARADRQALHRVMVRSVEDRRLFHPQKEIIHGLRKRDTRIVLKRVRTIGPPRISRKLSSVRSRSGRRLLSRLHLAGVRRISRRKSSPLSKALLRVSVPRNVAICVRRKERREVMFARGHGGSKKLSRRRRRNELSNVRCK